MQMPRPLEGTSLQEHLTVEAYSMTGNGLYHQFMVMTGGWFIIVLTTLYSLHYIPYFPYSKLFWAPTHFQKIWKNLDPLPNESASKMAYEPRYVSRDFSS
jgi:dolichol kinase